MRSLCWCILVFGFVGCHRATPVSEISVASSGVSIQEVERSVDLLAAWPGWRGPLGNGVAVPQAVPAIWSESEGIGWEAEVPGRGHGSPTVVGDLVLLASADEERQSQMLLAYDRTTGDKVWEKSIHQGGFPGSGEVHSKASHANSTVACDGERAYIAFLNQDKITATALDLNGDIVWQVELGEFRSRFGYSPSPILYKSFVIFTAEHMGGGYIAALDSESGKIAWRVARPSENSHSSPVIAELEGYAGAQLLICGCHAVTSYDPASGNENWKCAYDPETTCGTIVTAGGKIFASGGYPKRQTICVSSSGDKLWDNDTKIYEPSMVVSGDALYAVSDNGIAYCWSVHDGEELWKKRLGGNFSSSPTLCGNILFVSDLSGKTYVFKASQESYQEIAVNRLGSDCYASPAIVDGQIFMRVGTGAGPQRREKLVCIGGQDSNPSARGKP